nr:purine-cytosine permease fcyb [Quercus suber]
MSYAQYDVEKHPAVTDDGLEKSHDLYQEPNGAVPGEVFTIGDSYYARAQRFAAKFHVELRGIERVPEDERTDNGFRAYLNVATMVGNQYQFHTCDTC